MPVAMVAAVMVLHRVKSPRVGVVTGEISHQMPRSSLRRGEGTQRQVEGVTVRVVRP